MKRSKTDAVDAETLLSFIGQMEFVAWCPPVKVVMALRAIARQLAGVTQQLTAAKNRIHVAKRNSMLPAFLLEDLERSQPSRSGSPGWSSAHWPSSRNTQRCSRSMS